MDGEDSNINTNKEDQGFIKVEQPEEEPSGGFRQLSPPPQAYSNPNPIPPGFPPGNYGGGLVTDLREGLRKLYIGSIFAIIVSIIEAVIGILSFAGVFSIFGIFNPGGYGGGMIYGATMGSVMQGILVIYGIIITFIVIALVEEIILYQSAASLSDYNTKRFGIGKTGMLLAIIGTILVIVGIVGMIALIFTVMQNPQSFGFFGLLWAIIGLLGIGGLIAFVGWILYSIMLIRLPEAPGVEDSVKTGGILILVGIVIPLVGGIISFIGWIMVLMGVSNSLRNPQLGIRQYYAPPPPPYSSPPYQRPYQPQQYGYPQNSFKTPQNQATIPVTCPYCGYTSQAPANIRGKWVKCPHCGNEFQIP